MFLSYTHDSSKTKTVYEKMKESVFLTFHKTCMVHSFPLGLLFRSVGFTCYETQNTQIYR